MAKVQDTTIVARLAKDVKLDGKLDEPFWQKCSKQSMNPWRPETFGIPGAETGVQVAWDEANLYVGIDCVEPYTKNMLLNVKTQDSNDIWKDSGVEIFLVPDMRSADQRYYQTLVNANGACADIMWRTVSAEMMLKKVSDYTFNPGTRVATSKTDKGYSVEIAIPLDKISPQKVVDDTVWKANFCRNRCLAGIPGKGEVNQHYTWTPGLQGFHDIDAFGRLVFYKE
jgi:hypothetical protein